MNLSQLINSSNKKNHYLLQSFQIHRVRHNNSTKRKVMEMSKRNRMEDKSQRIQCMVISSLWYRVNIILMEILKKWNRIMMNIKVKNMKWFKTKTKFENFMSLLFQKNLKLITCQIRIKSPLCQWAQLNHPRSL